MHPLFRSKPKLILLGAMAVMLQCCCCVLPIRWNLSGSQDTPPPAANSVLTQLPADSQVCQVEQETSYARTTRGIYFTSLDSGQTWQTLGAEARLPEACLPK